MYEITYRASNAERSHCKQNPGRQIESVAKGCLSASPDMIDKPHHRNRDKPFFSSVVPP